MASSAQDEQAVSRRVWRLRMVVGVLVCAAALQHLSPRPVAQPVRADSTPAASTRPTAHSPPSRTAAAAAATATTTSRAKGVVPVGCRGVVGLELTYPLLCVFGNPIALAFLGGGTLSDDFWLEIPEVVAVVLYNHSPRLLVPSEIGLFENCVWLVLNQAARGPLPSELGLLSKLTHFYCSQSPVTNTPSELALLPLRALAFDRADVHGEMPSEFASIPTLVDFLFTELNMTGTIPSELALRPNLARIFMHHCPFTGTIPTQLGQATLMYSLRLHFTELEGMIPSELGRAVLLHELWASHAKLSGSIPSQLGLVRELKSLTLTSNFISGSIPSQLAQLSNADALHLGNNLLSGTVPVQLALMPRLTFLNIALNALSGPLPVFPPRVRVLCDGSGVDDALCAAARPKFVHTGLLWAVYALAIAVMGLIVIVGVLFAAFRAQPVIRSTNPLFSLLTLLSLALMTLALFPYGITAKDEDHSTRTNACKTTVHLLANGVTLLLCCIAVRNYPIWRIFHTNRTMKRLGLTRGRLLVPVAANVVVTVAMTVSATVDMRANRGVGCHFGGASLPLYFLLAYALLLGAAATLISFLIRNTPSEFNDTQNIAKAMYVVMTFGVALVCLGAVATDPEPQFLAVSFCVALCVATFVLVVHASKLSKLSDAVGRLSLSSLASSQRPVDPRRADTL